jgi:hypothetical protein
MGALGLATSLELRVTCHLAFFHDEVLATGAAPARRRASVLPPCAPVRLWEACRCPGAGRTRPCLRSPIRRRAAHARLIASGVSQAVPAGWAPERVAGVYAAKAARARGRIQVQLQARPAVFGRLPPAHKLLHHALAWRAPRPAACTDHLALLAILT